MLKSIGAVLAGYLIFAVPAALLFVLSGRDPHAVPTLSFAVGSVVYGMAFAFSGGWSAGTIAHRNELGHAIGVASVILSLAVLSTLLQRGHGSVWTQLSTVIFMVPSAVLGGFVRKRTKKSDSLAMHPNV